MAPSSQMVNDLNENHRRHRRTPTSKRCARSFRASAAKCCKAWPISSSLWASKRSWAWKNATKRAELLVGFQWFSRFRISPPCRTTLHEIESLPGNIFGIGFGGTKNEYDMKHESNNHPGLSEVRAEDLCLWIHLKDCRKAKTILAAEKI